MYAEIELEEFPVGYEMKQKFSEKVSKENIILPEENEVENAMPLSLEVIEKDTLCAVEELDGLAIEEVQVSYTLSEAVVVTADGDHPSSEDLNNVSNEMVQINENVVIAETDQILNENEDALINEDEALIENECSVGEMQVEVNEMALQDEPPIETTEIQTDNNEKKELSATIDQESICEPEQEPSMNLQEKNTTIKSISPFLSKSSVAVSSIVGSVFRTNPVLDKVFKGLTAMRQNDNVLKEFDVNGFSLTNAQCSVLVEAVALNNSIERLNLAKSGIQTGTVVDLAKSLSNNKSIKYLNLESNHIGPVGVCAMARALRQNSTLLELNLSNQKSSSPIGSEAEALFATLLKDYNQTLLKLGLEFRNPSLRSVVDRCLTRNNELARKKRNVI
jgi:hypothetical protein